MAIIQTITGNHYVHNIECIEWTTYYGAIPLLSTFPFLIPFCPPFVSLYLLGTLLAVIGPVHLGPRLLVNWSPHFHPLPIPSPFQNSHPLGFPELNMHLTKTTSQIWLTRSRKKYPSTPCLNHHIIIVGWGVSSVWNKFTSIIVFCVKKLFF